MKSKIKALLGGVFALYGLTACGVKPDQAEPRRDQPSEVRVHRRFDQIPASSLRLTSSFPEIIQRSQLGESPWASWLVYDSRSMPALPALEAKPILINWLSDYGSLIGSTDPLEWQSVSDQPRVLNASYRAFHFQRFIQGTPVRDSFLQLIIARDSEGVWRLAEMVANSTGPITTSANDEALPDESLRDHVDLGLYRIEGKWVEWIPFARGEGFVHEQATSFRLIDGKDDERIVTILHSDASVLENYSVALQVRSLQTRALKRSYLDAGPREFPLSFATVHDADRHRALSADAALDNEVFQTISLQGPRAALVNSDGSIPSLTNFNDQGDSLLATAQSYDFAAVNAFVAVQRINRFVRQFLDPAELPFLDEPVQVEVNSTDGSCNAYYSPRLQRILLYKEDADCANTALLNDVIFHEWGHALDAHSGLSTGIVDYAFSEGIADTLAAFYNEDPQIAPGFYFNDASPVRTIANDRIFPRDTGSPHFEGGIVSGAFWDLRLALIASEGKVRGTYLAGQLFMRHLLSVDSYRDSYAAVLRLDDDDGRPETPSPHACLIQKAFSQHGLAPAPEGPCLERQSATVDAKLELALWEAPTPEKSIRLLASRAGADRVAFCWGTRDHCLNQVAEHRPMDFLIETEQQRFFGSEWVTLPAQLAPVTLLSFDQTGQLIGARQFVIHGK